MNQFPISTSVAIPAGAVGLLYHRAESTLLLGDIAVEEGAEIVKVQAGSLVLEKTPEQTWTEVVAGKDITAGVVINVHVKNLTAEARTFAGAINALASGPSKPAAPAAPRAEVVSFAPKSATQGGTRKVFAASGSMQSLPPIIHGKDGQPNTMGKLPQGANVAVRTAGGMPPGSRGTTVVRTGANNSPFKPVGTVPQAQPPGTGTGYRGQPTMRVVPGNRPRVVTQVQPSVIRHGQSPTKAAPRVIDVPAIAVNEAPVAHTVDTEFAVEPSEANVLEQVSLAETAEGAIADVAPVFDVPAMPEYPVLLLRGHALALANTIKLRVPFQRGFRGSVMAAFSRAMQATEEPTIRTAADLVVKLTAVEIQALANLMTQGRGTLPNPEAANLARAFERAFALDQSYTHARADRIAAARAAG